MSLVPVEARMSDKKYNHAFTIAFSLDSDMNENEYCEYMHTLKGLSELTGHLIHRAMHVLEGQETEAFDLCDSYEH